MALPPIKLRLDGEELHLVSSRELERWGGFLNGRRGAWKLVTPDNVGVIRRALMCPAHLSAEGVFTELRKQLEDGTALFFEVPPPAVAWDAPPIIDIHELLPTGGDETYGPDGGGPAPGLHWIEVVCVSARGESYAGARARVRLPDGRAEFVTLDASSSVRFDDLTEGGTVHFELSGDAVARGTVGPPPTAQRYELGGSVGLSTQRRHVLEVHPNPRAFVSVELLVGDEPVVGGQYTLTTQHGEMAAALEGEVVRDEGFVLPSESTYSFEGVILPPRSAEDDGGGGSSPVVPVPLGPGGVEPRAVVLVLEREDDGAPMVGVRVRLVVDGAEFSATSDEQGEVTFVDLPEGNSNAEVHLEVDGDT